MGERLHYIDIFKGICLIFVVVHHAPLALYGGFAESGTILWYVNNFIIAFFMPAFFMATGYCSSFKKPFKQYLLKNVKTILLPCYCLYYLNRYIQNLDVLLFEDSSWMSLSHWLAPGIRTFVEEGGFYWFLSSLFLAKLMAWCVNLIQNVRLRFLILLLSFVLGLYLYQSTKVYNLFFFQHAMMLMPFLFIGKALRQKEILLDKYGHFISLGFFIVVMMLSLHGFEIPTITRNITVTLTSVPLFLVLSVCGSLAILYVSKQIRNSMVLEFLGKGSLVEYCFNYATLALVSDMCRSYFYVGGQIWTIPVVLITLLFLGGAYWILNHKYLRVLIGKF